MKVDGVQIREALSRWKTKADTLATQFPEACWAFQGEEKQSPFDVHDSVVNAEEAVAQLEELQQAYNSNVCVLVQDKSMTLARAVKLVGGAGRRAKAWKDVARDTGRDRYSSGRTRSTTEEVAKRTVSVEEALGRHAAAERYASAIRSAIARGNMTQVEIGSNAVVAFQGFDSSLFE